MSYGSTEVPATAFAITTVNVPDRLDLRDMDDRKQVEEDTRQRRFDLSGFRVWAPRLFLIAVLAAIVFVALEIFETWRTALSAPQLSQRLTAALGVPVQIETSRFALNPSPRLLLGKVSIDHKVVLDEVSVNVGTRHIAQVFQGHGWNWGEAVVGPTLLSLEQCRGLLNLLPKLNAALPKSLSMLRFDRLMIADQPWLAGQWQIAMVRETGAGFASVSAEQRSGAGLLRFDIKPTAADPDTVGFQMEGRNWTLPFGPSFPIEESVATGQASSAHVEVSEFSLGGPFGGVKGSLSAGIDGAAWTLTGFVDADGLDIAALIRQMAPAPATPEESNEEMPTLVQGNASFTGKFEGKGGTLSEAAAGAVFVAPVQVRWPVLNGINLGYMATRPGATGGTGFGTTRLSTLSAVVVAGGDVVSFRDIRAHAGALATSGQVDMGAGRSLSGALHVDLGSTRVLAPIRVAVHGTLFHPEFGR